MSNHHDSTGTITGIFVSPEAGAPMHALDRVEAIAGQGLAGDRYQHGDGFMSDRRGGGLELTLVEEEALTSLSAENGVEITAADSRRNLATRGVDLAALVGRQFRIGEVACQGVRLCEPCVRIEQLIGKPFVRPMVHRAGLRADILSSGIVRVGDTVVVLPEDGDVQTPTAVPATADHDPDRH
ncbi:MAG: MOSC domain-containing protein [Chloroflexota bacterium]|nr:MOSC domain-containing protein [Chloroflexota bacterium]